jgi:hypothetical protein
MTVEHVQGTQEERLRTLLEQMYGRLYLGSTPLTIVPPIHRKEAISFLRGFEERLFSVDDDSYVQTRLLPERKPKQKIIQLFWRRGERRHLFREGVCQLSTVSALIWEYGWEADLIKMEPSISEFGNLAYAVDILLRDSQDRIVACGEVKRGLREFNSLIAAFRQCCRRGMHSRMDCAFKQNHPKYEFCYREKPKYFFAAAPGEAICFRLNHNAGMTISEEQPGLVYRNAPSRYPRSVSLPTSMR